MYTYRIDSDTLWLILAEWDRYLSSRIQLVACGGTALTIQNIKPSTKDVDFMIPDNEQYERLTKMLIRLGYKQTTTTGWSRNDPYLFDLFRGNWVYSTELLESPLKKKNHVLIKTFDHLEVSALNDIDLIITKLIRGSTVDFEDCMALIASRGKQFKMKSFVKRYKETSDYLLNPEPALIHLKEFQDRIKGM